MTEPAPASAVAPVAPTPARNRLGVAALVLVLVTLAVPIIVFIVFVVGSIVAGAQGDAIGYAALGAFFVAGGASAIVAPVAILGVVLGIVAVLQKGKRKLQGVLAIVLGIAPALFVFGLPTAIDYLF
ncbi:MAG: hypothetical protein ABIQ01_11085 [Pseudolysinimonas sp.]